MTQMLTQREDKALSDSLRKVLGNVAALLAGAGQDEDQ